ncbi:unnamed protein product [Cyprideis torosa]|uniref:peptidylprolyl isomerase n=1 Tax=Cyprideis torosa TaxID=163714 RepID=A0A7R8WT97_9CRUS|nr:unnamed protein product [Cyprideis torosa]CAG0904590.1 unnamed protein product [Cyprideis torosa]
MLAVACNNGGKSKDAILADEKLKVSYALGLTVAENVKKSLVEQELMDTIFNREAFVQAFEAYLTDSTKAYMTVDSAAVFADNYMQGAYQKWGEANEKVSAKYVDDHKKDFEVTESGLLYKELQAGTGDKKPTLEDMVKVKYTGKTTSGKVFDSTEQEGRGPAVFPLGQVIPGWKEGLQLMTVGSKYRFIIPASLAYGPQGPAEIGPNQALDFEVELLEINPEPPKQPALPPGAQPGAEAPQAEVQLSEQDLEKDEKLKVSYALGMTVASNVKASILDQPLLDTLFDQRAFLQAFETFLIDSSNTILTIETAETFADNYFQEAYQKWGDANEKASEKFIEDHKKDFKVTESGLMYKVLKAGNGNKRPTEEDVVKVKYTGRTPDGKVFDSTEQDGRGPAEFPLRQVIPGWVEGLQLMTEGAKFRFILPATLAYGPQGPPEIGPNQALDFEVELLEINPESPASIYDAAIEFEEGAIDDVSKEDLEKDEKLKASYAIGVNIAESVKATMLSQKVYDSIINKEVLVQAFVTQMSDSANSVMTAQESQAFVMSFMQNVMKKAGDANAERSAKYIADNKKNFKVTQSGLLYKQLKAGKGAKPTLNDVVKVRYTGKTPDGKVFDSTEQEGRGPATFPLANVIEGWKEGLQLMPVGSKFRFIIPADLAYGANGPQQIGANQALDFEVELLEINPK